MLTQLLDCDATDAARIMRIRPATVRVLVEPGTRRAGPPTHRPERGAGG